MINNFIRFGFGVVLTLAIAGSALANVTPYEAQVRFDVSMTVAGETIVVIPGGSRVTVIAEFYNGAEISYYQVIYQGQVYNVNAGKI